MRRFAWVLVAAVASASCGLGLSGTGAGAEIDGGGSAEPPGAAADGASGSSDPDSDALAPAPDAAVDAPACSPGSACTFALAAGWSPLAFATDRSAPCPAGFTELDLVASPVAAAGACSCGCQISGADPPTCAKGSFAGLVGTSSCTGSGVGYNVNGTGCTQMMSVITLSAYAKYTGPPFIAGTCAPSVVKDAAKLSASSVRACAPPPECAEDVCAGPGSAPFGSCIVHDGDVACPAGPFANKTLAGTSATLTCGGCATCQNTGSCGPATLHFFNDAACATELATRGVDGACNALSSGTAGTTISYFRYAVTVVSPSCAPTSSPTTTAALDVPRTVCCR